MKKIIIFVVILIITFIILGVTIIYKNTNTNKTINIQELATQLINAQIFEDSLAQIDKDSAIKKWGFNAEDIKDIVSYVGTGATAEEILIMEIYDGKDKDEIKKIIEEKIEERKTDFQNYLPKEVFKLENYYLKIKNNYIILCISNDYDKANKVINDYIKS